MWATTLWNHDHAAVQWATVVGVSLIAATWDIRCRRIPNLITGPFLLAGLVLAAVTAGWAGLADAVAGCCLAALPFILLFTFGGGGAGDAKLMGGIGAWLGVIGGGLTLAVVAICGGLLAIALAAWTRTLPTVMTNLGNTVVGMFLALRGALGWRDVVVPPSKAPQLQTMPYGVAIFLGSMLSGTGVWLWNS